MPSVPIGRIYKTIPDVKGRSNTRWTGIYVDFTVESVWGGGNEFRSGELATILILSEACGTHPGLSEALAMNRFNSTEGLRFVLLSMTQGVSLDFRNGSHKTRPPRSVLQCGTVASIDNRV
jgi:hypothetical protein